MYKFCCVPSDQLAYPYFRDQVAPYAWSFGRLKLLFVCATMCRPMRWTVTWGCLKLLVYFLLVSQQTKVDMIVASSVPAAGKVIPVMAFVQRVVALERETGHGLVKRSLWRFTCNNLAVTLRQISVQLNWFGTIWYGARVGDKSDLRDIRFFLKWLRVVSRVWTACSDAVFGGPQGHVAKCKQLAW